MRLLFGAGRMQTVCLSGRHLQELLADKGCRLPLCFAPEPSGISSAWSIEHCKCGCSSVRGGCKLCACLAGTHNSRCLPKQAAVLSVCFALRFGATRMQTECLLPTKAACLSVCFALRFDARRMQTECFLPTMAATLSVCFALLFDARRMQNECLPTKAATVSV